MSQIKKRMESEKEPSYMDRKKNMYRILKEIISKIIGYTKVAQYIHVPQSVLKTQLKKERQGMSTVDTSR
jgi:hypothetical protein